MRKQPVIVRETHLLIRMHTNTHTAHTHSTRTQRARAPSTQAKARMRRAKGSSAPSQRSAHSAFFWTHGTVSMARNRWSLSALSLMYVSISSE